MLPGRVGTKTPTAGQWLTPGTSSGAQKKADQKITGTSAPTIAATFGSRLLRQSSHSPSTADTDEQIEHGNIMKLCVSRPCWVE